MRNIEEHNQAVKDVQKQVAGFFTRGQKARIFHGGTNSTRARHINRSKLIDISRLNQIIEINTDKRYVIVEPNVSLEQLVDATLNAGFMPPVISEFPAITVGGAIQGGAGESSSFKYGCLHEPCLEYEIVLGDGSKAIASSTKNKDLFHGAPCSYGSLGVITLIKLRLIPATPNIKLAYHKVATAEEAVKFIDYHAKETNIDFIDGIMFSKNDGVVMLGRYTDETNLPAASFHKYSDEWFYLHAQKVSVKETVYEELVPTKDYLFRYDRGAFWMGREGAAVVHIPFNRLTRLILAPLFKTRTMYRFLHDARLGQQFLVQDICLPKDEASSFISYVNKHHETYPLWLCPLKSSKSDLLSPTYLNSDLVINVGVWGRLEGDYDAFVRLNQELENEVSRLGGRKVLYAHAYYKETDFWTIYDKKKYQALRQKYSADIVFPDIYEKTYVPEKYNPSIARGWWKLLRGF